MNKARLRMYNPNQNEEIRKQDMFGNRDGNEWDGKIVHDFEFSRVSI